MTRETPVSKILVQIYYWESEAISLLGLEFITYVQILGHKKRNIFSGAELRKVHNI